MATLYGKIYKTIIIITLMTTILCNPVTVKLKCSHRNCFLENINWRHACGSREYQSATSAASSISAQSSSSQLHISKPCLIINGFNTAFNHIFHKIRNTIVIEEIAKVRFKNDIEGDTYQFLPKYEKFQIHTSNASSANKVTKKSKQTVHQQKIKSLTKNCQLNTNEMQKWYTDAEIFVAAFSHLSYVHAGTGHENSTAEYTELHTLYVEAKALLCEIETIIHSLTNFQLSIRITSLEDMKKLLTFRNNKSNHFEIDFLDTLAVKYRFSEMIDYLSATINDKHASYKEVKRLRNAAERKKKNSVKGLRKRKSRHSNKRKRTQLKKKKQLTTK